MAERMINDTDHFQSAYSTVYYASNANNVNNNNVLFTDDDDAADAKNVFSSGGKVLIKFKRMADWGECQPDQSTTTFSLTDKFLQAPEDDECADRTIFSLAATLIHERAHLFMMKRRADRSDPGTPAKSIFKAPGSTFHDSGDHAETQLFGGVIVPSYKSGNIAKVGVLQSNGKCLHVDGQWIRKLHSKQYINEHILNAQTHPSSRQHRAFVRRKSNRSGGHRRLRDSRGRIYRCK